VPRSAVTPVRSVTRSGSQGGRNLISQVVKCAMPFRPYVCLCIVGGMRCFYGWGKHALQLSRLPQRRVCISLSGGNADSTSDTLCRRQGSHSRDKGLPIPGAAACLHNGRTVFGWGKTSNALFAEICHLLSWIGQILRNKEEILRNKDEIFNRIDGDISIKGLRQWDAWGNWHKRQKPQSPVRNRQARKVANAKGLNRNTNLT